MKRIKFFLLILLIGNLSFGQDAVIEYSVLLNKSNKQDSEMLESYPDLESNLKLVTLSLLYNENEMKFYVSKTSSIVTDDIGSSLLMSNIQGVYHRKNNSDELFVEIEKYGEEKNFVVKKRFITDWNITNEKKTICGYECIKANCVLQVDYGDNNINKLYPLTAWYCPQLKYSYGPKGYGNLPGIILEVEETFVIYSASKINIDKVNENISLPTDKKIITESKMFDLFENSLDVKVNKCQSDAKKEEMSKVTETKT